MKSREPYAVNIYVANVNIRYILVFWMYRTQQGMGSSVYGSQGKGKGS
jgi:hypothetical protein